MLNDNLIGHGPLDYIVVAFLVLYAFWAGLTRPERILYILPACLSFFFFIEIGPRITPDKVVPMIFVFGIILNKGTNYFSFDSYISKHWINKVLVLVLFSFIVGLFYLNLYSTLVTSPFLKTRLYIQLIGYINLIIILLVVRVECSKEGGYERLIKSFLVTTTMLCIYGVYQYFAHLNGWPYRGIVYNADKTGLGAFNDVSELIFRINSFANEPKRLTYFLVVGILILLKYRVKLIERIGRVSYFFLTALHFSILWLTYSTSIYLSIAVFMVLLTFYGTFISINKPLLKTMVIFVFVAGIAFFSQRSYLTNLYEVRVEAQLENEEVRAEVKGQQFIEERPHHFLFGIGPGNYNFALADAYPNKAGLSADGKFLIPFNSGIMTYLYDFGIIGLLILLTPLYRIAVNRFYSSNPSSVFIVFLYCAAITLNPSATLFCFIGAFEGLNKRIDEGD